MTIRVLLADDEAMIRTGLRLILESETDMTVVGEAADGEQAIDAAAAQQPDVILMDIRMPRLDGLAAARRILAADPAVKIVVLTTFNEDAYLDATLRLGASGFLLKVAPPERLVDAVRVAARGDALLDPIVTRQVIAAFAQAIPTPTTTGPPPGLDQLTARELHTLHLLARGLSNSEIAAELAVGDATAKTHVSRVLMKLGLRDRVQAVIYAYEHRLIQPETPRQIRSTKDS